MQGLRETWRLRGIRSDRQRGDGEPLVRNATLSGRWSALLLAAAALVAVASPARAEVSVDATLGFAGLFRVGYFSPLEVGLRNDGADVRAVVEVVHDSGSEFDGNRLETRYVHEVDLPHGARKRLHLTVAVRGIASPLRITVRRRDAPAAVPLATQDIDLRRGFVNERLLAVVSRSADLDALNTRGDSGLRVTYVHPDRLPRRWQGYGALAGLLLHDVTLDNLSRRQYEALRRWIAGGGVLMVSGGPQYSALRGARFADLLPGLPDGIEVLDGTATLTEAFADLPSTAARFTVHRVTSHRGRAVHGARRLPLVIREEVGQGSVAYLTFDIARYPFSEWDGLGPLVDEMLQWGRSPVVLDVALRESVRDALSRLVRAGDNGFPATATAVLFAVLYIAALTTLWTLRVQGRLGGASTIGVAAVFCALAFALFGPLKPAQGATMVSLGTLEPLAGSGYARLSVAVAMYGEQPAPLRLEYTGAEPLLQPKLTKQSSALSRRWRIEDHGSAQAVQAGDDSSYVLHRLSGEDIVEFPVGATLEGGNDLRLRVSNASGVDLGRAWLARGGRLYRVGEIAASASSPSIHAIAADGGLSWPDWRAAAVDGLGSDTTASIVQKAVEERIGRDPSPLLFAAVPTPLRTSETSAAAWKGHALALLLARPRVAAQPDVRGPASR